MTDRFMLLVNSNQRVITSILNRYCFDIQEHEDLRQEILKELWVSFPTWREDCNFTSWTWRIARNIAVNRLRNLKKQIKTVGLHNIFYDVTEADVCEPVTTEQVFSVLTENEKELILQYATCSYAQLSIITGLSENVLRVKIHRIKCRLRQLFPPDLP